MNKSQRINQATSNVRKKGFKYRLKRIITFPWRVCCAIWNWLKSIDVIGMVNLTLLVVIIVLFSSLIADFLRCRKCHCQNGTVRGDGVVMVQDTNSVKDNRKVVKRKFNTTLPLKADSNTNVTPKIKTVGVAKPEIVRETSLAENELPPQKILGDVVIDVTPVSPVLSNGVKINGNLTIQNMRRYTLPCGTKINGHLFIRNVEKLYFCGSFTVNGNVYVNRQSSFGPLPQGTKINGQIIL